jgi:hypothetical protein
MSRRQHQPDGARRRNLASDVLEACGGMRAFAGKITHDIAVPVIDYALVTRMPEPPGDVCAHASKSDYSQLHAHSPKLMTPVQAHANRSKVGRDTMRKPVSGSKQSMCQARSVGFLCDLVMPSRRSWWISPLAVVIHHWSQLAIGCN